jgi:hypothetical protein
VWATKVVQILQQLGYRLRTISGEYFINESNLKMEKYYDSFSGPEGGLFDVSKPSYYRDKDHGFYLIEKVTA